MKIDFYNLYRKRRRFGFAIIFGKGRLTYKYRLGVLVGVFALSITKK